MPAPLPRIAGFDAAWVRVELDVGVEDEGVLHRIPVDPIELYALADPTASIDAEALLREAVTPDPPYWALVWTGAQAIAAVVSNLELPPGARVIDLGCGLGLSGLAAARRGARVVFGDYLEAPVAFVRATLARLGLDRCEARMVDFTRTDEDPGLYDLILAADIVYDPAHYRPLAEWLDRHLAPGGTILLTESLRADAQVFLADLCAMGFEDERAALRVLEDGRRERTWLHGLRRTAA